VHLTNVPPRLEPLRVGGADEALVDDLLVEVKVGAGCLAVDVAGLAVLGLLDLGDGKGDRGGLAALADGG
jgi:hypothetical protein